METKRKKQIREWVKNLPYFFASCGVPDGVSLAKELVEMLNDTPDVVKCEDCKHFNEVYQGKPGADIWALPCSHMQVPDGFYCGFGEPKDGDGK